MRDGTIKRTDAQAWAAEMKSVVSRANSLFRQVPKGVKIDFQHRTLERSYCGGLADEVHQLEVTAWEEVQDTET